MACGIGACLCCAQKTRDKDGEHMKHVCKTDPFLIPRRSYSDG